VELIPDLEALVARQPFAEGLRRALMLAMYRSGRQADALRVYREGRARLVDELGIEPGAELQDLQRRILDQDPALAPPPVAAAGEGAAPRQERKLVTLLVAEVVPARTTDPEDIARIARPMLERSRSIVERLGGTAEPLFANALLGVFGAPRAHDDDPLRAVRAGLEIRATNADRAAQLRIGIETGDALVSLDGASLGVTGAVLGAAAHLQAGAPLGEIVVGEATRRVTESRIEYGPSASGAGAALGLRRPSAGAGTAEVPFVGRSDELALLERIYRRARDERSVQLVTVAAEPGGGKSRLVRELRATLERSETPPTWRQGQCLPYGDGITYWALGELVKEQAGILESDDSDASRAKLAAAIEVHEPDTARRSWLERSLAALVGIEGAASSGDRDQAFTAWRHFLEGIAADGPLVITFEDIHWADDPLLEFIVHLVAGASDVPLLVLCTARLELLETRPSWAGGLRNATTIALSPLSSTDTEQILNALLGRAPDAQTVRRAGGNPLFAHELAMVLDRVAPDDPAAIPESLQAVIAARLDTLAPDLKSVAADAAVVGEVFWSGALAAMGGLDDREVEARVRRLVANDVARRHRASSVERQSEYQFLHVLVRDVAYGQIPRRDRISKHRSAADWIEALAGDRPGMHAELVAHHLGEALELARGLGDTAQVAELRPRTRDVLLLAGEHAQLVELGQADAFYRRAVGLTEPGEPVHGRLLGHLADVAELTGRHLEAEALAEQAIAELRSDGDLRGAGEVLVGLVTTLWRLGRPEAQRRRVATEAIEALEQLPAGPSLVRAYARMATHELHAGRADACGQWSQKALAIADGLGEVVLKVQPLHHLGIARFESGDLGGIDDIRAAMQIGLEAGLSLETGTAYSNLGAVVWVTDGPLPALAIKQEAAAFASSRGLTALERTIRAESLWQQFDAGLWDDGLEATDQLIEGERGRGPSRVATMAMTVKTRTLAERGRFEEAAALEPEFLNRARELADPQDLGPALAASASLQAGLGNTAGAAALIAELEEVTRGRDASQRVHELPHAARVCLAGGTIDVARALIPERDAPTYPRARLCLASGGALIAEADGKDEEAARLHAEAADGWAQFGCPAEEAHARIGFGRAAGRMGRTSDATVNLKAALAIADELGAAQISRDAQAALAALASRPESLA
jgi:tetratricopeptide (TPR) repeat protein